MSFFRRRHVARVVRVIMLVFVCVPAALLVCAPTALGQTRPVRRPPPPGGSQRVAPAPSTASGSTAPASTATATAAPASASAPSTPAPSTASASSPTAVRPRPAAASLAPPAATLPPVAAPGVAPALPMIPAPVALPVYGDLPPPPGYVLDEHPNVGLIAGGLVTFGTLYGVSIIYGGTQGFSEGMGNVAVPVIGPWLAIAARDLTCTDNTTIEGAQQCQQETIDETAKIAVLSGLGIGQLIGATLTVIGIFDKDQMWVRADAVDVSFRVDTMNVTGGSGVRLHGEF